MMILMIGGSGSGKSAYAENYITHLSKGKQKYYLATMQVFDEEGQEKVDRHRKIRKGKGFLTIEQPRDIHNALDKMKTEENVALLECMSNLVANEMFIEEVPKAKAEVTNKIVKGIEVLKEELTHLVIVSNNVFEDGVVYEEAAMEYLRAMGEINERLAAMADEVVEVVVGIPIMVKTAEKDSNDRKEKS